MSDIEDYVRSYDGSDDSRISFAWNGKHADDFQDANVEFRRAVLEHVCDPITSAPIPLLRDLYKAETCFSKEAWGTARRLPELAREFLTRGGPEYVDDYLRGRFQSFDAARLVP